MTKAELIYEWRKVQEQLQTLKMEELRLRNKVLERFGDDSLTEGTQNIPTDIGVLSITKSRRYTLENREGEAQAVAEKMSSEDRMRLFSWSAKLDVKEYKQLLKISEQEKKSNQKSQKATKLLKMVDEILTIKDSQPQLKIK